MERGKTFIRKVDSPLTSLCALPIYHAGTWPYRERARHSLPMRLKVRLRIQSAWGVRSIWVRSAPEGEEILTEAVPSAPPPGEEGVYAPDWEWWEANLEAQVPQFTYRFLIVSAKGTYHYNAWGLSEATPLDLGDFKVNGRENPPLWVQDAIFYQIFPDRFWMGNPSHRVRPGEVVVKDKPAQVAEWDEPVDPQAGNALFYGGDLEGVVEKLPYLEELGIDAIYLNPIFLSPSNHKYDVADYFKVDPHLGGEEALISLRQATQKRGMRLILDFVPNHCGDHNRWFLKAQSDPHSIEYTYFTFYNGDPHQYEMWLGVSTLPRLNYTSSALREVIYRGPQAAMRHWLRPPYSIDGWRLDVANMLARQKESQLGHEIGREMRQAVKEENPQAWLVGEHFYDYTPYQQGDEFDAAMNYRGFCMPLWQWMAGWDLRAFKGERAGSNNYLSTEALLEQLQTFRGALPEEVALNMLNLLSSHDTPRLLTICRGQVERVRALMVFLFGYQGAPCIYYGEEIGLEGGADPLNRGTMDWNRDHWNLELWDLVRQLIEQRRRLPALRRGCLQWLGASRDSLAFLRQESGPRVLVAVTRAQTDEPRREEPAWLPLEVRAGALPEGSRWLGVLSKKEIKVREGRLEALPGSLGAEMWVEITKM